MILNFTKFRLGKHSKGYIVSLFLKEIKQHKNKIKN